MGPETRHFFLYFSAPWGAVVKNVIVCLPITLLHIMRLSFGTINENIVSLIVGRATNRGSTVFKLTHWEMIGFHAKWTPILPAYVQKLHDTTAHHHREYSSE